MAIDTAAKRASAMGFAFPSLVLVPPDGSIDNGDRQTITHVYGGISAQLANLTFGVLSIMTAIGKGILSSITSDGKGQLSSISATNGVLSVIQSRGKGVSSLINSSQGEESEL